MVTQKVVNNYMISMESSKGFGSSISEISRFVYCVAASQWRAEIQTRCHFKHAKDHNYTQCILT